MLNCSRMRGTCLQLVFLVLILGFAGCSSDDSPEMKPTATPDQKIAKSATPKPKPKPGESAASSGGGSGSSSSSGSRVGSGQSRPDSPNPHETGNTEKEKLLTPAEWRRKNFKPREFSEFKELRGYLEVRGLSPQPATSTTIASGKKLYSQACVACHNLDGSPVGRDPALLPYKMADLSLPQQYHYGSGPKSIFRSIMYGLPSPPMGFTGSIYSRTQVWDMVNYIQSIQKTR